MNARVVQLPIERCAYQGRLEDALRAAINDCAVEFQLTYIDILGALATLTDDINEQRRED